MPERKWVVNSSPIISLCEIGRIYLLEELCDEIVIPSGVLDEINAGSDDDSAKLWLNSHGMKYVRNTGNVNPAISAWDIGKGETEVINRAYGSSDYTVILDDRAARNCALSLNIRVLGTVGIIVLAKKEQKIREAAPLLFQLVQNGFRISDSLIHSALQLTGE